MGGEPGRHRWTDDRIDDLAGEVRELRVEMREGFRELRQEMRELRSEGSLNRSWLVNLWVTTMLGFVAVLVQVSLR
jgi:hypothetical protein